MANDTPKGDSVIVTALQRQKVMQALDTHIGVLKRRINAERSDEIKAILRNDVEFMVDIQRKFVL